MKEFLKTRINWKNFTYEMFIVLAFLALSYWAGNNKFPHNFWFVPVGTIGIGIAVLFHVYLNDKIKKEKEEKNGKNK
jgi:hypothetical protein